MWKKNVLEDLEVEVLEYETVKEFLANIKKEFRRRDEKIVKVTELKNLEQKEKTIKEFV